MSEKVFVSRERVSGLPEKGAHLWEVRGTSVEVLIAAKFHIELLGKFGELSGKSGKLPKAQGSLAPSQRLAKFVSNSKAPRESSHKVSGISFVLFVPWPQANAPESSKLSPPSNFQRFEPPPSQSPIWLIYPKSGSKKDLRCASILNSLLDSWSSNHSGANGNLGSQTGAWEDCHLGHFCHSYILRRSFNIPSSLLPCPIWLDDQCTGQWKGMEEVPRRTSLVPLAFPCFVLLFNRGGSGRAFRLPGAGGGSFPLYGGTFARSASVSTPVFKIIAQKCSSVWFRVKNMHLAAPDSDLLTVSDAAAAMCSLKTPKAKNSCILMCRAA